MASTADHNLVMGWKVTERLEPYYWLRPEAVAGEQSDEDLVLVELRHIAHNTAIVAQSGSGAAFFLGRYVEEIALKTKCRILILDSISDFRKADEILSADLWTHARYDSKTGRGFLPHERDRAAFAKWWNCQSRLLFTTRSDGATGVEPLRPDWSELPVEWLFDDIDTVLQNQLRCCHEIVKAICDFLGLLDAKIRHSDHGFLRFLTDVFAEFDRLDRDATASFVRTLVGSGASTGTDLKDDFEIAVQRIAMYRSFVTREAAQFYFNVAFWMLEKKQVNLLPSVEDILRNTRIEVVDLPSVADPIFRAMVVNTILEKEATAARKRWYDAFDRPPDDDRRVPTIIVVNEAHQFATSHAKSALQARTQELFRMIAAESGRLGVFLVLVSQRPDRLDPLVISECENRAIMRIGSSAALRLVVELLGLNPQAAQMADKFLDFQLSRVLMIGPWAGQRPEFLFAGARRIVPGGRTYRTEYWATPSR